MEEFQESEVLWPADHHHHHRRELLYMSFADEHNFTKQSMDSKQSQSRPVDIPAENKMKFDRLEFENYEDDEKEKMVLPPHEMLANRFNAQRMAFSVCTGNGRTLKGRDLSKVRNSILRMTGFLETC
ncbi:senescence regulator (Protein of unknown function, DUF584) [Thalictrum thalictroides]|uniref:Senescence regulator n=1 Tax=Thalictrum thalictroides TaxID=46969 RepID=A0A7J6W166_THATH|nr:senescence regulator (Protein of unknown function, DUF584) [Thalictrum thalictroides]